MFRPGSMSASADWFEATGGRSPCILASGAILGLLEGSLRLDSASGWERRDVLTNFFQGRALEGVARRCFLHCEMSGPPHNA